MDLKDIRKDFPVITDIIYFDNACMTISPYSVIKAVNEYYNKYPVCGGGRSTYSLSSRLARKIDAGREAVAKLINADYKEEIIFTKNTTESINLLAKGLDLEKGDVVLSTDKEHNSNLIPWIQLKKQKGIDYRQVPWKKNGSFDVEKLKEMMGPDIKVISMVHTSNLDGTSLPVKEVEEVVHDNDALLILDGAQSVPHRPVDVKHLRADFLAFSLHKMLGPTGVGVLYGKKELLDDLDPLVPGGGSVKSCTYSEVNFHNSPAKFEGGLQNYSSLCGVEEAVKYISDIGLKEIEKHESKLNKLVTKELKHNVEIIGPEDPDKRSGIFNFRTNILGAHELSVLLEEQGIMTRSGMQCLHSWHESKKVEPGTRASFYFYNTKEEITEFINIIKDLTSTL